MPDPVLPIIRESRLGGAPPGATLRFTIPKNGGYTVEATLFLESKVVAAWESIEILGKTTEEVLIPKGLYTLQIDIVFTKTASSSVQLVFMTLDEDVQLRRRTLTFTGNTPEIGRALAILRVETP